MVENFSQQLWEPSVGEKRKTDLNPFIEELRRPIKKIINKLREKIDNCEYTHIIGDDASGRIPALVFRKILEHVYKTKGKEAPKTFFIPGHSPAVSRVKKIFPTQVEKDTKILIVTDTIVTGNSLYTLTLTLKEFGIPFDIATIGIYSPLEGRNGKNPGDQYIQEIERALGGDIFYGSYATPELYEEEGHKLTGVKKDRGADISFRLVKQKTDQDMVNKARKDANILAEELVAEYEKSVSFEND
ncbi:MAG: hypothetical protein WC310_03235 [Patescibacteria group bacterium]|jgi:hypothetical protein